MAASGLEDVEFLRIRAVTANLDEKNQLLENSYYKIITTTATMTMTKHVVESCFIMWHWSQTNLSGIYSLLLDVVSVPSICCPPPGGRREAFLSV